SDRAMAHNPDPRFIAALASACGPYPIASPRRSLCLAARVTQTVGAPMPASPSIETLFFADDGIVPNNPRLPLLFYRGVLGPDGDLAASCAAMFTANGWPHPWRNGIYGHHHYHSTAHEVLGIAAGSARVRLGGDSGRVVELNTGDVVVIPAGVAHKRESAS